MDHKLVREKKSKVPGCLIALLIMLIIGCVVAYFVMTGMFKMEEMMTQMQSQAGAKQTVEIESGDLTAVIDDVSGTVRSKRSIELKWKTTGNVAVINTEIGKTVQKDDVLAELSLDTVPVSVLAAEVEYANATTDLAELKDTSSAIAAALSELVTAQKDYDDAKQAVADIDPALASQDTILLAHEAYLQAQAKYDAAKDKFEEVRNADPDNDARKKRLGDVSGYRNARDNALAQYRNYLSGGDALEKEVREAALQLAAATLEQKQQDYETAKNGPTAAELAAAQAKIDAAMTTINSSRLIAPFDGVVTKLNMKLNDTITSDDVDTATAIRIDDMSQLLVDIDVSELQIAQVKQGMDAEVTFLSVPDKTYHGVVSLVADTGTQKDYSVKFVVTILLTDADEKVVPGLTANVRIPLGSATDTLYVPVSAVYLTGEQPYVNLIDDTGMSTPVAVQLGVKSGLYIEVKGAELTEGAKVENFETKVEEEKPMMPMF